MHCAKARTRIRRRGTRRPRCAQQTLQRPRRCREQMRSLARRFPLWQGKMLAHKIAGAAIPMQMGTRACGAESPRAERLPELVGNAPCMLEVSRRVRLVAPRMTPVLIEGPTGSGKELVAEALHRLSTRSRKPFVAINCAAIPEALLEAELFGHTRGAFTGAVQGRTGRIEAADGGTLFLDEIGEMPLALQSKLLRFVECGELQRVGDNETVKVDVRIIAATHRPLAAAGADGKLPLRSLLPAGGLPDPHAGADRALRGSAAAGGSLHAEAGPGGAGEARRPGGAGQAGGARLAGQCPRTGACAGAGAILAGESPVLTAQEIDFGLTVN